MALTCKLYAIIRPTDSTLRSHDARVGQTPIRVGEDGGLAAAAATIGCLPKLVLHAC